MIHLRARRASPSTPPAQPTAAATGLVALVRQAAVRCRPTAEHLAVLLLGLLVLAVHDVGYMLKQPFWTDEAWVAVTTRFPLYQLPATTDSTPIGWSVLMRLFTVAGTQTSRLLPLAFAGAAVVMAYWFGRALRWPRKEASVVGGILAATAVLLVPAMLVRNDLKQYTADACTALLVLALTSRLERGWSRTRLVALSAAVWGGMLFSDASAFAGVAAFGSVCVIQLVRRAWRRLAEAAAVGAGTAILMLAVYEAFDARAAVPGLISYWSGYYLPAGKGLHADIHFLTSHYGAAGAYLGLGPAWVALPLFLTGLVTIFRLGMPATAVTVAVLWPEMLGLSAAQKYPFLDVRTSTFLFTVTAAVAAIAVAWAFSLLQPWLKGAPAAGLVAVAVAAFVSQAQPYVRSHTIPNEDVRDQARYVAAHAAPGDVILVNLSSNWGFAYYWAAGVPARRASAAAQGYEAYFPGDRDIVVARTRDSAGVGAALSQALSQHRACGRIWLIRTHVIATERQAWITALRQQKLTTMSIGHHGLSGVDAGGSRCQ